jgi:hypothetical protein
MKVLARSSLQQQAGSMYSTLIMVVLIAIFFTAALKIVPAYLNNNVIVNAMEGMAENNDMATLSIGDIRSNLMRTLNTNDIRGFDATRVQVVSQGSQEYIDINYETRIPLFYNIEAIVKFENRFDKF